MTEPAGEVGLDQNERRVVVVTSRGYRGEAVVEALATAGVRIDGIVLDGGSLSARDKMRRSRQVARRSGFREVLRRAGRRVRRSVRPRRSSEGFRYQQFSGSVNEVADINGEESTRILRDLAPDLIVLGSSRILKEHTIAIPRAGTINAHPGILPTYRGVDVIEWAILQGDPLGVTVHWVDRGVDTGQVLAERRYDTEAGDTMSTVRGRAADVAAELITEVTVDWLANEDLPATSQPAGAGKLYTRMTPQQQDEAERVLQRRVSSSPATER